MVIGRYIKHLDVWSKLKLLHIKCIIWIFAFGYCLAHGLRYIREGVLSLSSGLQNRVGQLGVDYAGTYGLTEFFSFDS